jgi:type II secretion system (T2SS) protein E
VAIGEVDSVTILGGDFLNGAATVCAVHRYCAARWANQPLVWLKTAHNYPSLEALRDHKRPIEELLIGAGHLKQADLDHARASLSGGQELVQYLIETGRLTDEQLLEVLSLQHGVETASVDSAQVRRDIARSIPVRITRKFHVLPLGLEKGELRLASPQVPPEECRREISRHTSLNLRVVLVTRRNFQRLCDELL